MMSSTRSWVALLIAAVLALPVRAGTDQEDPVYSANAPKGFSAVGDFFIARPLLIGATVIGSALFLVSLPFSLASGSVGSTAESLVLEPGREAFVRCLGCTRSGYGVKDSD